MTDLEKYCTKILDNKIVACEKMKKVSEMLLDNLYNPNEFHFDTEIANRHVEFIETFCKQPTGKLGAPLKLELFQKARLQAVFGFVDNNNIRQYNECLIIEGRKNGKTTESAGVELDLLVNDKEGAPQVYNVATMKDQANLGFNACYKMVKQSPFLKKNVKKRATDLYFDYNMGFIKALASNTNSLDGLDVHGAIIDELSAIKNRDIYDLIKQGMGARVQPLLFCITTNGFLRNGIFDAQYEYATKIIDKKIENKRFLPFIYELDSPEEWDKPKMWIKANPGIGTIKSQDYLQQMVDKAKNDASFKSTVMVKDFNIPETSESRWLRFEEINNTEKFNINEFDYCIGGFDGADTTDLCSAVAIMKRPNDKKTYVKAMFWLPEEVIFKNMDTRRERDNAPYKLWVQQGYLRAVEGHKVDKKVILEWFNELKQENDIYTRYFGYDPWHIDDSLKRDFETEYGNKCMYEVRQGVRSLSEPMKEIRGELQEHNIVYDNNPILKWCLMNTEIKTDINGNIQPVKSIDSRLRIDGTVALICGYKILKDKLNDYIHLNKSKEEYEENNGDI